LKILNVNVTVDAVSGGGTAERTLQMSKFLIREGAECAILTLDAGLDSQRLNAFSGVSVTALRCVLPRYHIFPVPEPRVRELVKWADVVHLMNHWTLLNAMVYRAARRAGRPYVVCPAGALQIYGHSRVLKKLYNGFIGNRIVRNAAACAAIAANEIDQFRRHDVADHRIALIPNGVDPQEFRGADPEAFRKKFGIGCAPFILFMGRLHPIKGPDLLLRAFSQVRKVFSRLQLVFAGPDGGMLATLRTVAHEAGVADHVHFVGHVSGSDKASAYSAARLLAIPSRQEAMSIVVLEAGICATPVLITDRCGFDEVEHIGGGKVVSASPDGLESGLLSMLSDDASLRDMGHKLKNHVIQHYLWESVARKYLALFDRIVTAKR
jgi:glycosyltransferase involved in cell wall biosynthesis